MKYIYLIDHTLLQNQSYVFTSSPIPMYVKIGILPKIPHRKRIPENNGLLDYLYMYVYICLCITTN